MSESTMSAVRVHQSHYNYLFTGEPSPAQFADEQCPNIESSINGMGACYSGRSRTDPYIVCPSNMPQPQIINAATAYDHSSPKKPHDDDRIHLGRNSNEQPVVGTDRVVLSSIGDTMHGSKAPKQETSRFGFKFNSRTKSDPNKNSVSSASPVSRSRKKSHPLTENIPCTTSDTLCTQAYAPKGGGADKWLMIDDSRSNSRVSTVASSGAHSDDLSSSLSRGNSSTKTKRGTIDDKVSTTTVLERSSSDRRTWPNGKQTETTSTVVKSASLSSRMSSRLRGPFARFTAPKKDSTMTSKDKEEDKWVKANVSGPTEKPSGKSGFGFFRRGFGAKQSSLDKSLNTPSPPGGVKGRNSSPPSSKCSSSSSNNGDGRMVATMTEDDDVFNKSKSSQPDTVIIRRADLTLNLKAPIAVIDSVETTSVGSLNSDDMMLDSEINLDGYDDEDRTFSMSSLEKSHGSLRGRKHSRRSRSHSRDSLDGPHRNNSVSGKHRPSQLACTPTEEKEPVIVNNVKEEETSQPVRPTTEGNVTKRSESFTQRRSSQRGRSNTLQELNNLLHENQTIKRRPLKLANMNRPASFPGPVKDVDSPEEGDSSTPSGEPGCKSFRPPRQTPSIGDEEQFCLEGFVLRNAMQDITQIKTKLLKLRRVIQEDEFAKSGSCLNGLRTSNSQPTSPMREDLALLSYLGESPDVEGVDAVTLKQENMELRLQLSAKQTLLEEQEKTIHLLQEQMPGVNQTLSSAGNAGDDGVVTAASSRCTRCGDASTGQIVTSRKTNASTQTCRDINKGENTQGVTALRKPSPITANGSGDTGLQLETDCNVERELNRRLYNANLNGNICETLEDNRPAADPMVISSSDETMTTDTSGYISDTTSKKTNKKTANNTQSPKPGSGKTLKKSTGGKSNKESILRNDDLINHNISTHAKSRKTGTQSSVTGQHKGKIGTGGTTVTSKPTAGGIPAPKYSSKSKASSSIPARPVACNVGVGRGRASHIARPATATAEQRSKLAQPQSRLPGLSIHMVSKKSTQLHSFGGKTADKPGT